MRGVLLRAARQSPRVPGSCGMAAVWQFSDVKPRKGLQLCGSLSETRRMGASACRPRDSGPIGCTRTVHPGQGAAGVVSCLDPKVLDPHNSCLAQALSLLPSFGPEFPPSLCALQQRLTEAETLP